MTYGKTCVFFGQWYENEASKTDKQLFNVVKVLVEQFDVQEFWSGGFTEFDTALENAVLRYKKKNPVIKLMYLQKYQSTVDDYRDSLLSRYDVILAPNDLNVKRGETSMLAACRWAVRESDYVLVCSPESSGMVFDLQKKAGKKYLFNLALSDRSWNNFVSKSKQGKK